MTHEQKIITVTSPLLPPLDDFSKYLEDIWENKWITNNGSYHKALENALCEYLKVPYISLFTNGTLPLITSLQALRITGEVITTPYSFVATTHSLWWNGIKPVFVDIDPKTGNLDPNRIEAAITPQTTAIMPVHVYGCPCRTKEIQDIADKYGLKVIYDAAHAFGVEVDGKSILNENWDFAQRRAIRSIIAKLDDHTYLLLTATSSHGFSLIEAVDYLIGEYAPEWAYNLDGGPSSALLRRKQGKKTLKLIYGAGQKIVDMMGFVELE